LLACRSESQQLRVATWRTPYDVPSSHLQCPQAPAVIAFVFWHRLPSIFGATHQPAFGTLGICHSPPQDALGQTE